MKRGLVIGFIFMICISFVSAGLFGNMWNKFSGKDEVLMNSLGGNNPNFDYNDYSSAHRDCKWDNYTDDGIEDRYDLEEDVPNPMVRGSLTFLRPAGSGVCQKRNIFGRCIKRDKWGTHWEQDKLDECIGDKLSDWACFNNRLREYKFTCTHGCEGGKCIATECDEDCRHPSLFNCGEIINEDDKCGRCVSDNGEGTKCSAGQICDGGNCREDFWGECNDLFCKPSNFNCGVDITNNDACRGCNLQYGTECSSGEKCVDGECEEFNIEGDLGIMPGEDSETNFVQDPVAVHVPSSCNEIGGYCQEGGIFSCPTNYKIDFSESCSEGKVCCKWKNDKLQDCIEKDGFCLPNGLLCVDYGNGKFMHGGDRIGFGDFFSLCSKGRCCKLE